jgi:hypothetical protein
MGFAYQYDAVTNFFLERGWKIAQMFIIQKMDNGWRISDGHFVGSANCIPVMLNDLSDLLGGVSVFFTQNIFIRSAI